MRCVSDDGDHVCAIHLAHTMTPHFFNGVFDRNLVVVDSPRIGYKTTCSSSEEMFVGSETPVIVLACSLSVNDVQCCRK